MRRERRLNLKSEKNAAAMTLMKERWLKFKYNCSNLPNLPSSFLVSLSFKILFYGKNIFVTVIPNQDTAKQKLVNSTSIKLANFGAWKLRASELNVC